jgi:hypothetical protein
MIAAQGVDNMATDRTEIWHYNQMRPGVAISENGRVKVYDNDGSCLIFPAPAAEILECMEARAAADA